MAEDGPAPIARIAGVWDRLGERFGRRVRLAGAVSLVLVVALALVVVITTGGEDDGGEAESPATAVTPAVAACGLITAEERREALGVELPAEPDPPPDTCRYGVDGGLRLAVRTNPSPTPAAFRALVSEPDAEPVDVGDEARLWFTDTPSGGAIVVRVGGTSLSLDLTGPPELLAPVEGPAPSSEEVEGEAAPAVPTEADLQDRVRAELIDLASAATPRLPDAPYTEDDATDVAAETCAEISVDELAGALGLDDAEGPTLSPLGTSGCVFSTSSGVNLSIEVLQTDYSAEQLDGLGRELTQDGETFQFTPEPVPDLGDHAVWLADPVTGVSGELYALYGTTAVRVTSTGPTPGSPVRDWAVTTMGLLGPQLAE